MPDYFHSCAGVPLPTLQWYKDATSISKLQDPRYKMLSSGGLRIQKLRPEDSGIFQCFASNEGGEIQTYTYLDVTSESCPPRSQTPCAGPSTRAPHSENRSICSANGQDVGTSSDPLWRATLRPTKAHVLSPQAANTPHCPYALPPDLHSGEPRALLSAEK